MTAQCSTCHGVVVVTGDRERMLQLFSAELWPEGYPCVYGCDGRAHTAPELDDPEKFLCRELTPEEYFRALHGGGLPEELAFDYGTVKDLLTEEPITGIVLRDWGTGVRPGIERISTDKHEIHLSASPNKGVQVLKVTTRR